MLTSPLLAHTTARRIISNGTRFSPGLRLFSNTTNMKPVTLYSLDTPNGQKVTTFTEELKAAYPDSFKVDYKRINIMENTQKEPWFLAINPNGRIPALVDPNNAAEPDFAVFESAAILLYLLKHYDPEHKFSWPSSDPKADNYRNQVLQWIFFVHGGVGPMQGQANHFVKYAPEEERNKYGAKRYKDETKRLYSVLESHFAKGSGDREYLVGEGKGKYTIADANGFPWVWWGATLFPEQELLNEFPKTFAWVKRCYNRPATKAGVGSTNDGKVFDPLREAWSKESGLKHE